MDFDKTRDLFLTQSVILGKDNEIINFTRKQKRYFDDVAEKFLKEKLFHLFPRKCGFMYYFGFVLLFIIYYCLHKSYLNDVSLLSLFTLFCVSCLIWDNLMSGDFVKFAKRVYIKFHFKLFIQKGLFSPLGSSSDFQLVFIGYTTPSDLKEFRKKFKYVNAFPVRRVFRKNKPIICIVSSIKPVNIRLTNVKQFITTRQSLETVLLDYYLSNSSKSDYISLCQEFYFKVSSDYLNYKIAMDTMYHSDR